MNQNQCRYCKECYVDNNKGDHVFPKGLGGEDIYMKCVCPSCNAKFSQLERELIQKSPIGLMRSVEGIEGYKRNSLGKTPWKAPLLIMPDATKQYVYEVRQNFRMEIDVKPQTILFKQQLYIEGDTKEGVNVMISKFNKWCSTSFEIITDLPTIKNASTQTLKFSLVDNVLTVEKSSQDKPPKGAIISNYMSPDHELYESLTPRLYLDDDLTLKIRAKNEDEIIDLIKASFESIEKKTSLTSYQTEFPKEKTVSVGFNFDSFKTEQALVKISINCLLYYFKDATLKEEINDAISFVMRGNPCIPRVIGAKNDIIDSIPQHHSVFFQQGDSSLHIRISLFTGSLVFTTIIPDIQLMPKNQYARLLIDYHNKKNTFQDQTDFLKSFIS